MGELLFGVETEYAIAGVTRRGAMEREETLQRMMEFARKELVHLPDLHGSGGMYLGNGARFYLDCGMHPEMCTPECANPWDAVRSVEAGHRIVAGLAARVEAEGKPGTEVRCFRCNVDYSGSKSTWGCHESYMHRRPQEDLQAQIVPHLVTRQIYTGAGGFNPLARGLEFTLSPRMAYFRLLVTESSTSGRGIWHEKSESLSADYDRLHVLCGESLCSETATFLKIGVTALIVAMADAGLTPGSAVQLADPLQALHTVAGDVSCAAALKMADGRSLTAIAIQRSYLEAAEAHLEDEFMPLWAGEVCQRWRAVLDQLEGGAGGVEQVLDWGIKRALYANHAKSLGVRWDELPVLNEVLDRVATAVGNAKEGEKPITVEQAIGPIGVTLPEVAALEPLLKSRGLGWKDVRTLLKSRQTFFEIDMRFGQLGPRGIFASLDSAGVLNHHVDGVDNIELAMTEPPARGRARVRGQAIRRLAGHKNARCDWQYIVDSGEDRVLDLTDPFIEEEQWRPLSEFDVFDRRVPHRFLNDFAFELGSDDGRGPSLYARRVEAFECYQRGDYSGAEERLRLLVDEGYELASNRCHIARALMLMGRDAEARQQVDLALGALPGACRLCVSADLVFQAAVHDSGRG